MPNRSIEEKTVERLQPRIWQWDYLGLQPLLTHLIQFSQKAKGEGAKRILDLGCGAKPYASLFPFADAFVGFDVEKNENVDFVGFNWDLPFSDDEFDALICTQVLEHTAKTAETIQEMKRVVRSGGLIYVSVPLTFPEHGIPYDYYRFTRYGLLEIFKDFKVLKLEPHNGYIATLFRLLNTFFIYFPGSRLYLFPVFFINNVLALLADYLAWIISRLPSPALKEAYNKLYMGMTESYTLVLRNTKPGK